MAYLETCSSGHDEVVYMVMGSSKCPACEAIEDKERLEKELDEANDKVENLENENEELQDSLDDIYDNFPEMAIGV